ncbi:hypothetical protein [Emticicia sp. 17c]|uniref:hypothetical protein n=1 Tax=Emticicia sp. 17c TaxID=3127704 RepID=UPI00301DF9DC
MKKLLSFFCVSLFALTTSAQVIPQGTRFIGGGFYFSLQTQAEKNEGEATSFQVSIAPSITYFKKDNFSITYSLSYGISTTYYNYKSSADISSSTRMFSNNISASLFLTNYKMLTEKLGISIQYGGSISTGFSSTRYKRDLPDMDIKQEGPSTVGLNLGVGPGVIYLISDRFAIEGNTSLINLNAMYSWGKTFNGFNINTGASASPSLGIGIRYFMK